MLANVTSESRPLERCIRVSKSILATYPQATLLIANIYFKLFTYQKSLVGGVSLWMKESRVYTTTSGTLIGIRTFSKLS
jgi:hypothetical protein